MSKPQAPTGRKVRPAVGPQLKKLLNLVFGLFALLMVNAAYLTSVTIAGTRFQNWFYLLMFATHLVLGLLIILPVIAFGIFHIRNTKNRRNKRAIKVGYALFIIANLIFFSGIILTRIDIFGFRFEVNHPVARATAYWFHVICPLLAVWLFILHRLAGRPIKWKLGLTWAGVAAVFVVGMLILQTQDPRAWNVEGPKTGEKYFFPSLARTSTGNFIPGKVLSNDAYCQECHADVHEQWSSSVHKFSSFNNPPYLFSVKATRQAMMARDGNVQGSRFCAGCHDPVPFFSGAFDDPKFDDPNYDLANDSNAQAGITCTVCHSISHINSLRGNSDYTIDEPVHYPFTFSQNDFLRWTNRQLIKAKPEFHKATFLKPLHKTSEFCGTCHKVHLPPELNSYKWLRGQNHFDSFWLSGVSGQGVTSFYYPPKAEESCNGCHLPLEPVSDQPNFGAKVRDESGVLKTMTHQFPSANTAIPHLLRDKMPNPDMAIAAHKKFNEGVMRIDLFGIKQGGRIDDELVAPLDSIGPALQPGQDYLLETVIRTLKMGHEFTQGTADSNQVWVEITAKAGDRVVGVSGGRTQETQEVDPWSHFVNAFVIDRNGNRINRRNAEDIFIALYNNQIPPGAGDVIHYLLNIPADLTGTLEVTAKLLYRKFDTEYMRLVTNNPNYVNDLPIMTLAEDRILFPIGDAMVTEPNQVEAFPLWQRWNDYGIGLLRKGSRGQLRQAKEAFEKVEALNRPEGPVNLARVYIKEGLVQKDAPEALARAAAMDPPAYAWSLLWFGAEVASRNGDYAKATENIREILRGGFAQAEGKGFDFSKDYRVWDALGNALYQQALLLGETERKALMGQAEEAFQTALRYDPENLAAHWGLRQVYLDLGDSEKMQHHTQEHARYKPDDNARDIAVSTARRQYPAANHAAEEVVIHNLQRPGNIGLPASPKGNP